MSSPDDPTPTPAPDPADTAALPPQPPAEAPAQPAPPPPAPPLGTPAYGGYAQPYPPGFAPVAQAPKVPWINPLRRTRVLVIGLVAAVVLLGGGIGIGVAVGDTGGSSHPRFVPAGDRGGYGPNIGRGGPGDHRAPFGPRAGNGGGGQRPNASPAPSGAPRPSTTPN